MKQIPIALRLLVMVLLASSLPIACNKESSSSNSGGSSSSSGGKSADGSGSSSGSASAGGSGVDAPAGQGDAEAVKAVCDELARHWVKTADGWVSEFPSQVSLATGKRAGPESYYRQIKALKFTLDAGEVSASDKLNGLTYRGTGQFENAPVRVYNDPSAFGQPRWSDWHESNESVFAEKKNGKWNIVGTAGGWMVSGEKPAAATLSKIK